MKQRFKIKVERFRREEINETRPDGGTNRGHRNVSLGFFEEEVEVEVDLDRIARQLGQSAVWNKGGVSREIGGLVVVRHLRRKQ